MQKKANQCEKNQVSYENASQLYHPPNADCSLLESNSNKVTKRTRANISTNALVTTDIAASSTATASVNHILRVIATRPSVRLSVRSFHHWISLFVHSTWQVNCVIVLVCLVCGLA